MVLTLEQIEQYLGKVNIPAPKEIIFIQKGAIEQGNGPYQGREALGIHRQGANQIVLTADSNVRTLMHESTHNMGFVGETITRTIAALANFRAQYRILPRITGKQPQYVPTQLTSEELQKFMDDYHVSGDMEKANIVKLVLMD